MASPHLARLVLAFAAVYLIWGSTYLAIGFAVETMPPMAMAAVRYIVAGTLLLGWCAATGRDFRALISPRRLLLAAAVGTLMLGGGNGLVVWAIARGAPTGLTAVIIATTPFWLVAIDRVVDRSRRIAPATILGLLIGFGGIVTLAAPGTDVPVAGLSATALGAVLVATLAWACGSMLSRGIPTAPGAETTRTEGSANGVVDMLVASGAQMVFGGAALLLWSLLTEPVGEIDPSAFSMRSWLALIYLILFGSIVAYTAFIWLLRNVSAAAVGTYAYVNPIVALVLGVLLNEETITLRAAAASAMILVAVIVITLLGRKPTASRR